MIDFRYHVVSIIAVFLALSVGLVLGSSFLADIVKEDLDNKIQQRNQRIAALEDNLRAEQGKTQQLQRFTAAGKAEMVSGKLGGKSVALVVLPDAASDLADATKKTLEESGATVTSTVTLKDAWVDPAKESALSSAAGENASGQSAADRAAAALAGALVHKGATTPATPPGSSHTPNPPAAPGAGNAAQPSSPASGSPPLANQPVAGTTPDQGAGTTPSGSPSTGPTRGGNSAAQDAALATLKRLKAAGFLDFDGKPEQGATLTVLIAPSGPVEGNDPGRSNGIYLGLSRTLDTAGDGTVMAGDAASAQSGGTIAALRGDDRTAKLVSTVDSAESTPSQVAVDWALVVESTEGKSGKYGPTAPDGWLPQLPVSKTETEKTS